MLVIRRRLGEGIQIGPDIWVRVLEISHTRVKLGIEAPRSLPVERSETMASAEENRRASAVLDRHEVASLAALLRQGKTRPD